MPHQEHRIPWNTLSDSLKTRWYEHLKKNELCATDDKILKYFANAFNDALLDFAKTDKSENELEHDLIRWSSELHIFLNSAGGYMGSLQSVIECYIMLNLLLVDYNKYKNDFRYESWTFHVCRGEYDGGHPSFIADKFALLFDHNVLKDFTVETKAQMIELTKFYFKCLYKYVKTGVSIENTIYSCVKWLFPHEIKVA